MYRKIVMDNETPQAFLFVDTGDTDSTGRNATALAESFTAFMKCGGIALTVFRHTRPTCSLFFNHRIRSPHAAWPADIIPLHRHLIGPTINKHPLQG